MLSIWTSGRGVIDLVGTRLFGDGSSGDREVGDLLVGLRLGRDGGVDSPVDVKSLWVTFRVPMY